MLRNILLVACIAILSHKVYRYCTFMGYIRSWTALPQLQASMDTNLIECTRHKYKNLFDLNSTLDADMLPNGLSVILSSNNYSLIDGLHHNVTLNQARNSIYMLDMNHFKDGARPFALSIMNKV
jgi:hypothetical protein